MPRDWSRRWGRSWARTVADTELSFETLDWMARARTNGSAGADPTTLRAIEAYVRTLKGAGIWSQMGRLNLFCGRDLAACLTPLIRAVGNVTENNSGFVAANYSSSTGLQGNGTSKFLNTGVLLSTYSVNNRHMSVRELAKSSAIHMTSIGTQTTASADCFYLGLASPADSYRLWAGGGVPQLISGSYTGGAHFIGVNASPCSLYKNGAFVMNGSPSILPPPNTSMTVFARNVSGSALNVSDARLGGYSLGMELSPTQAGVLYEADLRFQQALGRLP